MIPGKSGGTYGLTSALLAHRRTPRFVQSTHLVDAASPDVCGPKPRFWRADFTVGVLTKDTSGGIILVTWRAYLRLLRSVELHHGGRWHLQRRSGGTQAIPGATIGPSKFFAGAPVSRRLWHSEYRVLPGISSSTTSCWRTSPTQGMAAQGSHPRDIGTHRRWRVVIDNLSAFSTRRPSSRSHRDPRHHQRTRSRRYVRQNPHAREARCRDLTGGDLLLHETTGGHSYSETYKTHILLTTSRATSTGRFSNGISPSTATLARKATGLRPTSRFGSTCRGGCRRLIPDRLDRHRQGRRSVRSCQRHERTVGRPRRERAGRRGCESRPTSSWIDAPREQFWPEALSQRVQTWRQGGLVMPELADPLTDARSFDFTRGISRAVPAHDLRVRRRGVIDASPASTDVCHGSPRRIQRGA